MVSKGRLGSLQSHHRGGGMSLAAVYSYHTCLFFLVGAEA
jgi:hypothetical protein